MSHAIDFGELKQRVSIERAAEMLGAKLTKSGAQLRGPCPNARPAAIERSSSRRRRASIMASAHAARAATRAALRRRAPSFVVEAKSSEAERLSRARP